ncbi:MAG TPA: hypothetical protein VF092_27065 [Longimicrobium sp.]
MTDPSPPLGFGLLILGLLVYVLMGLLFVGVAPPGVALGWIGVLQVASVALAAVTIEALWTVRPWVTRASAALAITLFVELAAFSDGLSLRGRAGLLLFAAALLLAIVGYVHARAEKHFRARVPAARRP